MDYFAFLRKNRIQILKNRCKFNNKNRPSSKYDVTNFIGAYNTCYQLKKNQKIKHETEYKLVKFPLPYYPECF